MTIENDLQIDLLMLERDAVMQPSLYHKWAIKYAEAHSLKVRIREQSKVERIRLKQELDEKRAALELDIRSNWDTHSAEKKTEGGVMSLLANHLEYKEAQERYLEELDQLNQKLTDATHDDLIMEAARDAMQYKQQSIKIAAELYLGGYFSTNMQAMALPAGKEVDQTTQRELKVKLKKRGT